MVSKFALIRCSAVREEDDSTNDENNQQRDERRYMMDSTRLKATPRTPRYVWVFSFQKLFVRFNRHTENKKHSRNRKMLLILLLQFHWNGVHFNQNRHYFTFFLFTQQICGILLYTPCNLIRAFRFSVQFKYLPPYVSLKGEHLNDETLYESDS